MAHNAFSEEEFESEEALTIKQFSEEEREQAPYNTDLYGDKQMNHQEPPSHSRLFLDDKVIPRSLVQKPPRRRWLAQWLGVTVGIGLGMAIAVVGMPILSHLFAKNSKVVKHNRSPTVDQSVAVEPARLTRIAHTLNVTGTVVARDSLIPVLPLTTGLQIKQVLVKEGDVVQAGQQIAVLDQSVLQTQLEQAQAELEEAQALVEERLADRAQSQAKLAEAQRELQRYQTLANAGAISRQELDTRATTVETDLEGIRIIQANISNAQAQVHLNVAHVKQLQVQMTQTVVRAPVSGVIAEKIAQVGDVTGTQKLFSIIRDGLLEVQAQVPEIKLPQVKIGALAQITSAIDSQIHLQGQVKSIAPIIDPQNRQAKIEIDLPLTRLLRPGQFVQAAIAINSTNELTVPAQSVLSQATGGWLVFVLLANGTVRAQPVQVGEIKGNQIEIKQGLEVGNRVVVTGAGFLHDGDRVQVVTQPRVTPNYKPQQAAS